MKRSRRSFLGQAIALAISPWAFAKKNDPEVPEEYKKEFYAYEVIGETIVDPRAIEKAELDCAGMEIGGRVYTLDEIAQGKHKEPKKCIVMHMAPSHGPDRNYDILPADCEGWWQGLGEVTFYGHGYTAEERLQDLTNNVRNYAAEEDFVDNAEFLLISPGAEEMTEEQHEELVATLKGVHRLADVS